MIGLVNIRCERGCVNGCERSGLLRFLEDIRTASLTSNIEAKHSMVLIWVLARLFSGDVQWQIEMEMNITINIGDEPT